jgi:hypothetical protein
MTLTMAIVRSALDSEEPDYESAQTLGFEALPFLAELANSADIMLASKAVYLAGLINGEQTSFILQAAARHKNSIMRTTAASVVGRLDVKISNQLLLELLNDNEISVQNVALKFLPPDVGDDIVSCVASIAEEHSEPSIRKSAASLLQRRSLARNMGSNVELETSLRGMGKVSDIPVIENGMGIANRGGGMGSPSTIAHPVATGLKRQVDSVQKGMGAVTEQSPLKNAISSAPFWENAALAWEKAASTLDSSTGRKTAKKGCGCGSTPH